MNLSKIKPNKKIILITIEIVILLIIIGMIIYGYSHNVSYVISEDSVLSDYVSYDDGWSVSDGDISPDEGNITLINCKDICLDKGTYSLLVWYETDNYQNIIPYVEGNRSVYLFWGQGNVFLRDSDNFLRYDFETSGTIPNLELHFKYDGHGDYSIKKIEILENQNGYKKILVCFLILAGIVDGLVFFAERIRRNFKEFAVLLITWFITEIPLFNGTCNCGYDFYYHTLRIEAIVRELQSGNFPFWIDTLFFDGAGYPSPVYYNDLFLYFPALLRMMGFYIYEACNYYFFFINALSIIIAFFCFCKIFRCKRIGVVATVVYVTVPYRLMLYYEGSNIGQFTAYTFIPLIALGVWEIYANTEEYKWRQAAFYIVSGMSCLIGCHVLSVGMVCVALAFIVILCLRTTLKPKVLITWIVSVLFTLLINLYFIIPFADYSIHVDTAIKARVNDSVPIIQHTGNTLMKYFLFFANPFLNTNTDNQTTPGLVLMGTLTVAGALLLIGRLKKKQIVLLVMSFIFWWMSTQYFPYNWFSERMRLGRLLSQIQFPDRWLSILSLLLTLLLGTILISEDEYRVVTTTNNRDMILRLILSSAIAMSLIFTSWCAEARDEGHGVAMYGDTEELGWYDVGFAEYLREGTDRHSLPGDYVFDNIDKYEILSKDGTNIEIFCSTGQSLGYIELPLQNYKGYRAWDENGNNFDIIDGSNNRVAFNVPSGFEGNITVDFVAPSLWIFALIISFVTVIFVIGYYSFMKKSSYTLVD